MNDNRVNREVVPVRFQQNHSSLELNLRPAHHPPECRICLQDIQKGAPVFCGCKGNHKNVHQKCLTEWLQRKLAEEDIRKMQYTCQLCRSPIALRIALHCEVTSPGEVCHAELCEKGCCGSDLLGLLVVLGFSVVMVGLLMGLWVRNQSELGYLLYVVYLFVSIGAVCGVFFVSKFMVRVVYTFTGVKGVEENVSVGKQKQKLSLQKIWPQL